MNEVIGGPDLHRPFVEKIPELDDLLSVYFNHDIAQDTGFLALHSNFSRRVPVHILHLFTPQGSATIIMLCRRKRP